MKTLDFGRRAGEIDRREEVVIVNYHGIEGVLKNNDKQQITDTFAS
jgi:hypothetical protein